ncbi:hypothetical protein [Nostoc sp. 106C]|uniref:hypothetical protein n=1 Tax=Nostoc sp. 106C TaxID=1932667 RepID=UPI000A3CB6C2|nr:hypothetical protein [Nostoc sp. 106C]OUL34097.1 hypothetical protein BV375_05310 [Nostoc sp. 106C]
MGELDQNFRSIDWANADLYEGIAQRPKSAIPLQIALPKLQPKPDGSPPVLSPGEKAAALEEQQALQNYFREQKAQQDAINQEIYKREQAARDAIRQRTPSAEPPASDPVITTRNPPWEQPPPTTEVPTQPGTPNSAKLPPTPATSGARALPKLDPTATPRPAALMEELPPVNVKSPLSLASSLPKPAGLAGGAAIGAGIDAGFRILAGQPPAQVGFGAAGNFAGSLGGALLGGAFGPAGAFAGGMIGGYLGGMLADAIYKAAFPSSATPPPSQVTGPTPFSGGQSTGIAYRVSANADATNGSVVTDASTAQTVYGPVLSVSVSGTSAVPGTSGVGIVILAYDEFGNQKYYGQGYGVAGSWNAFNLRNISINRIDGQPDTGGNPTPNPIPNDNRSPNSYFHPGNQEYPPPSGVPQATPAPNNYAPGGNSPGGSPRGDKYDWTPHGFPAPRTNPNPNTTPSNLGGGLPGIAPSPTPTPNGDPNADPNGNHQGITKISIDIGPSPKPPNFGDNNAVPVPLGSGGSFTVPGGGLGGLPKTVQKDPVPDATSPTPKNQDPLIPTVIPPLFTPATTPTPTTNPPSKDEIKAGVCELTAPDACLGQPLNNIQNKADENSSKLDQLNALLNGLDLTGIAALNGKLDLMNNKLGEQLPGGLAGKLTRFSEWLHLDRALNLMILATTIHNGLMLSNDIGQTLLGAINNILQVIGLKGDDGQAFDLGSIVSSGIENLIKSIVGEENYTVLNAAYQKANRIYQATTNVLNNLMNVNSVVTNALEVVGSYTGKIGNALRIWGVVGEKAYSWMNPQPSFDNKWITKLQQLQEGANTVAMVAQIPVDAVNAVTELNNSTTGLISAIKQDPDTKNGVDVGEAAKVKQAREEAKSVSFVPTFDISDLFDADD